MDLVSILVFVGIIILCGFTKMNTGLVCYGVALLLGRYVGLTDKQIVAGFNFDIFIMLLGITYLLGIARSNECLELVAKKVINYSASYPKLLPFVMYAVCLVMSAIGVGCMPTNTIMVLFALMLIKPLGMNPLLFCFIVMEGADGGNLSPLSTTGVIGMELCKSIGMDDVGLKLLYNGILSTFMNVVLAYLIFKGWKSESGKVEVGVIPKMTREQKWTLAGILVMGFCVLFFKTNVGLTAFAVALVLCLMKVGDEQKALQYVPWNVICMTTGVMMLVSIITKAGGIKLMSDVVSSFMTSDTVIPLFSICAGMLSWVSSTSGVVMPTMITAVPDVLANVGATGVNYLEFVSSITMNAHVAGISPFSSGGALSLAAYTAVYNPTKEEQHKFFLNLFWVSCVGILWQALLAWFGLFKIIL